MINVNELFKQVANGDCRTFRAKTTVNSIEYKEFREVKVTQSSESNTSLSFGSTSSATLDLTIVDVDKGIILTGQKIKLFIGLKTDNDPDKFEDENAYTYIQIGDFNIDSIAWEDNDVKITAYDNFYLCEQGFFTNLSGMQKVKNIVSEQCTKLGIEFVDDIEDVSYNIDVLKGLTIREAFGYLASFLGKNAIFNNLGKLQFIWYTDSQLTIESDRFSSPLTIGNAYTIGSLSCTVRTTITNDDGVTKNEDITYTSGSGEGISFSNLYMTQERLNTLHSRVKNFNVRNAQLNWNMALPYVTIGDIINVKDIDNAIYAIPVMEYTLNIDGGCNGTVQSKFISQSEQAKQFKGSLSQQVERIYTDYGSFKEIVAEKITAFNGKFTDIETDYLQVNKELIALKAQIEDLDVTELTARVAKIEEAYITKAEVEQLYATKAEIGILNADVANIKTLLAGSTTTGDLQAIVINSKNAIIENGTIKNAMIESLAFDKITGVDINTTKMTVHSNDGKSTWIDNTIQISDNARVRVQIGKDASNDYNIYIWDKTGKLMFDATGVTADGIQRPIIRDDMVSDTANINGKKINIQSVVKEINNGTEKIKSSTVLYDPTGQTLNIAFNELITTVDGIDDRVESNTTQISVANGEISTLISKTTQQGNDINNLQSSYSSLNQSVNGLTATVGEHTSKITTIGNTANEALNAINGLEIGGRNLVINSPNKIIYPSGFTATVNTVFDDATNKTGKRNDITITGEVTTTTNRLIYYPKFGNIMVEAGETYTLSLYIKADRTINITTVSMNEASVTYWNQLKQITTEYQKLIATVKINSSLSANPNHNFHIFISEKTFPFTISIHSLKIEKGNKATDWSPAPEDIDSSITEVSDKQSSMQLDLDGFKTSVSNTYATKTQLNTVDGKFANYSTTTQMNTAINQSASNIKLEASKTYATKNELTGKVDTDKVVSAINVSPESIKIQASKITLEGVVTANNYFKINTDGSMEAKAGKIGIWEINSYRLNNTFVSGVADNGRVGLSPGMKDDATGIEYASGLCFWAGATWSNSLGRVDFANAPFRVRANGGLYATNATIKGTITGATIIGSTITSGTTINVTTDLAVGNNIYVGSYSDRNTKKYIYLNDRFSISSRNDVMSIGLTSDRIFSEGTIAFTTGGGIHANAGGSFLAESGDAYIYIIGNTVQLSGKNGYVTHYGGYIDSNWSSGYLRPNQSGTALGGSNSETRWYRLYAANASSESSDERLKTNITDLDERYINLYEKLRPIVYHWKTNTSANKEAGLIAQEVQKAMHECCISNKEFGIVDDSGDYLSIIYRNLSILNLKYAQTKSKEVSIKLSNHDNEISKLKNEIMQLKQELKNTKDKLDAFIQGNYEIREVAS